MDELILRLVVLPGRANEKSVIPACFGTANGLYQLYPDELMARSARLPNIKFLNTS